MAFAVVFLWPGQFFRMQPTFDKCPNFTNGRSGRALAWAKVAKSVTTASCCKRLPTPFMLFSIIGAFIQICIHLCKRRPCQVFCQLTSFPNPFEHSIHALLCISSIAGFRHSESKYSIGFGMTYFKRVNSEINFLFVH